MPSEFVRFSAAEKTGTEFPVEVSISGWRTQQGMFFTGIVRDISERKRKDEELKEAYEGLELRVAERTAELVRPRHAHEYGHGDQNQSTCS